MKLISQMSGFRDFSDSAKPPPSTAYQPNVCTHILIPANHSMMATPNPIRPLAGLKSALRQIRAEKQQCSRWYATAAPAVTGRPTNFHPGAIMRGRSMFHLDSSYH